MTEAQLKQLGFKRKWLSDRSSYWMQLEIKSFINGRHITYERGHYNVWTIDIDNNEHAIICQGFDKTLKRIIKRLTI